MKFGRREVWSGRILLFLALVGTLIPLVNMLSAALQPAGRNPTGLTIPADPQWGNFVTAFNGGHVLVLMTSSLLIVLGVVPISLTIATLAGYALGNLRIKGGRFVFIYLSLIHISEPTRLGMISY